MRPQPDSTRPTHAFANALWAVIPERLQELRALLALPPAMLAEHAPQPRAARGGTPPAMRGAAAVLPIHGFMFQRPNIMTDYGYGVATSDLCAAIDQLAGNQDVRAIVLDVDSPGGEANGMPEFAARLQAVAAEKKVIAVANCCMASAAYWASVPAAEIVASPSAFVGSIGVFFEHVEYSGLLKAAGITTTLLSAGKYKTEGNDSEPLSEEAKAHTLELVQEMYSAFTKDVAKGRGTTPAAVRGGYGEGRILTARLALEAKLVDRIATLDEVIAKVAGAKPAASSGRRAETLVRRLALEKAKSIGL